MKNQDYNEFVDKFKPKKTTDDCYTPVPIYNALIRYIDENVVCLKDYQILRPFYPGGNFEKVKYEDYNIVIDNPPFSILAKIVDYYIEKDIKFWLFAPHLTLFQYSNRNCTMVVTNLGIKYENGAIVNTDFVTNILPEDQLVNVNGTLRDILENAQKKRIKKKNQKNVYIYPSQVVTSAELGCSLARNGINFIINKNEAIRINKLDCQKGNKGIFGSGLLISKEKARAKEKEKARAKEKEKERAKEKEKERAKGIILTLSEREVALINELDKKV
jgi:ribosomal protein S25|nr:MAG TPA: adenine-specific methyltransferase [Caudoviricetes sp.]